MPNSLIYLTPKSQIPSNLLPYLTVTGSLTARLEKLSGQKLIVEPTFEGRQILTLAEQRQLGLPLNKSQSAWVREVLLHGEKHGPKQGGAWVTARSVFPFTSLIGNAKQLANLGTTPIGYVMFGRGGASMAKRWIDLTENGWQRTSLYYWQGRKLLISETFLADFLSQLS